MVTVNYRKTKNFSIFEMFLKETA